MIDINLKKNQVPTHIDVPKKYKKPIIILVFTILVPSIIVVGIGIYFLFFPPYPKHLTTTTISKKNTQTKKIYTLKIRKNYGSSQKKLKQIETPNKKKPKTVSKVAKSNKKKIKTLTNIHSQQAIFKIALTFEKIQTKPKISKPILTEPLPKQLTPPVHKKEKKVNNISVIYQITVKTKRIYLLKKILRKFNINKVSITSKPVSIKILYNVYVGGFYSYPKTLQFEKILESKGYKTYGIENINLKYYVWIDKYISDTKKRAYKKAWSTTPYSISFKKIKITKFLYTAKFVSPNPHLIKTLKTKGFYTIIKEIKNGA